MRNIALLLIIFLLVSSCKKDECPNFCVSNIEDDIVLDIHYNEIFCSGGGNYEWWFNSYEAYQDYQCSPNVPVELGFNGIVLVQGVQVQFGGLAYNPSVEIKKDSCEKFIDFKFILTTIDTSRVFEHNENVLVLLDGIDSTYTVNFSHEIIPYSE